MNKPTAAAYHRCSVTLADVNSEIINAAAELPPSDSWILDDLLAKIAEARVDVARRRKETAHRNLDTLGEQMEAK